MELNKYHSSILETLLVSVQNSLLISGKFPLVNEQLRYMEAELKSAISDAKFEEERTRESAIDVLLNISKNLN